MAESKRMTVRELRKRLKDFDPDLPVYVRGYEEGVDDVGDITPITVRRDQNSAWYYGRHDSNPYDAAKGDVEDGLQLVPGDD